MDGATLVWLALSLTVAATLYSSVGHGGASSYIALMTLFGLAPVEVRPAALVLNILVAGLGAVRYVRAGRFEWSVFWPFAITAIPAAFFAGRIEIPPHLYKPLLAIALALAAARYLMWPHIDAAKQTRPPSRWLALLAGAALGAFAGLTGIGGGVYLSPLLVYAGWSDAQKATGIAALFIVVNSFAGLAGRISSLAALPAYLPWLALAVLIGGAIGTTVSLVRLDKKAILRALGVVLGVAAFALVT